jgi:hypothetical protein
MACNKVGLPVMGMRGTRRGMVVLAVAGLSLWWPAVAWAESSARGAPVQIADAATTPGHLSPAPPLRPPEFKPMAPTLPRHPGSFGATSPAVTPAFSLGLTVPSFQVSENYPAGNPYQDYMLGNSPLVSGSTGSTISTPIIPIKIVVSGVTKSDASAVASDCGQTSSAAGLTGLSPLFQNVTADPEGTQTQLIDAYERGNFNQETKPGGIAPNYHLLLSPSVGSTETVTVPSADVAQFAGNCGTLTAVDQNWWNSNFPNIVAGLNSTGALNPQTMPLFVLYNSVLCPSIATSCSTGVEGGYHNYLNDTYTASATPATQVYGVYDYDLTGDTTFTDTSVMSHEVGEAVNDPYVFNPVPTWGRIGQDQNICQPNLEVGDPLSAGFPGSPSLVQDTYMISSTSHTFHVQDLAYRSWFFREASPPSSVNVATTLGSGKYSMFGDLTGGSDSTVCPGQPTGVTAVPGNGQVTVSWTAGPGPVDFYAVVEYQGATPTLVNTTASSTPTSFTWTGLTNGTIYTFTVLAAHANSNSPYCLINQMTITLGSGYDCSTESLPSNGVTAGTPIAPTSVTASAVTGGAKVTWTAPSNTNGSPISGYVITPFLNGVAEPPKTFNTSATTETITGLTKGQHYTFRVAAMNGNGTGIPSLPSNSVAPK